MPTWLSPHIGRPMNRGSSIRDSGRLSLEQFALPSPLVGVMPLRSRPRKSACAWDLSMKLKSRAISRLLMWTFMQTNKATLTVHATTISKVSKYHDPLKNQRIAAKRTTELMVPNKVASANKRPVCAFSDMAKTAPVRQASGCVSGGTSSHKYTIAQLRCMRMEPMSRNTIKSAKKRTTKRSSIVEGVAEPRLFPRKEPLRTQRRQANQQRASRDLAFAGAWGE